MAQTPPIRSVMTASPRTVDIDAPVRVAQDLMIDFEIRHLPVTERDRLVGILSDRDIAFASNSTTGELCDRLRVRDVCSLEVFRVAPDAAARPGISVLCPAPSRAGAPRSSGTRRSR